MTDETLKMQISLYVSGDLEPGEVEELEAYLQDHPEAHNLVEKYRLDQQRIGQLKHLKLPENVWDGYWSELEVQMALSRSRNQKIVYLTRLAWGAMAASLLLALGLWGPTMFPKPNSNEQANNPTSPVTPPANNPGNPAVTPVPVNGLKRVSQETQPQGQNFYFIQLRKLIQEQRKRPLYLVPKLPGENRYRFQFKLEVTPKKKSATPDKKSPGKKTEKNDEKVMEF